MSESDYLRQFRNGTERVKAVLKQEGRMHDGLPHCDMLVLHRPGTCWACDGYPHLQWARQVWGINFTGEDIPNKLPCPATLKRSESLINEWPNNRPTPPWPEHFDFEDDDDPERDGPCKVAPRGWYCTRGKGHRGPCAAWPRWYNLKGMRSLWRQRR